MWGLLRLASNMYICRYWYVDTLAVGYTDKACLDTGIEHKMDLFKSILSDYWVSLSEPHTSELNGGFFIFIYMSYVFCMSV